MSNNKRIAKNTLMLYLRMMLVMAVSLYSSRIVIDILGVEDFGIYNVIGGIVVFFTFLNSALSSSTERFLAFDIGCGDRSSFSTTFSVSVVLHLTIAFVVLFLAETIGLWFINNKLNLPIERMDAVNWVYQFTVFTTFLNIIRVPYNSLIIAEENFSFYAYTGIIEVFLKLLLIIALKQFYVDKLIVYSVLVFFVTFFINLWYFIFCKWKNYYSFIFVSKRKLYLKQVSFSMFRLLGASSQMIDKQGGNIIINIYNGVLVNAAMGIANQVNAAVISFLTGFQSAFQPSITKFYAKGDYKALFSLIEQTAKYSFLLIALLAIPIMINMDFILHLWLNKVPDGSRSFCILILLNSIIEAFSAPLWMSILATGRIAFYQIGLSILTLLGFLISFIFLYSGYPPEVLLYVRLVVSIVIILYRLYLLNINMGFPIFSFLNNVILRPVFFTSLSTFLVYFTFSAMNGISKLLFSAMVFVFLHLIVSLFCCFESEERIKIRNIVINKLYKKQ